MCKFTYTVHIFLNTFHIMVGNNPYFLKTQTLYIVNNNNYIIMAVIYVPDDLVSKIISSGKDKQKFVKEAIEDRIEREME